MSGIKPVVSCTKVKVPFKEDSPKITEKFMEQSYVFTSFSTCMSQTQHDQEHDMPTKQSLLTTIQEIVLILSL